MTGWNLPPGVSEFDEHINPSDRCAWTLDANHDVWETGCGKAFQFVAQGPAQNEFCFCPYCGGNLVTETP